MCKTIFHIFQMCYSHIVIVLKYFIVPPKCICYNLKICYSDSIINLWYNFPLCLYAQSFYNAPKCIHHHPKHVVGLPNYLFVLIFRFYPPPVIIPQCFFIPSKCVVISFLLWPTELALIRI